MEKNGPVTVRFGGEVRELWTDAGLTVRYAGGLLVTARRGPEGRWLPCPPAPAHHGNVKQEYALASRELELAARLAAGSVPALTLAYFYAAADAAEALALCANDGAALVRRLSRTLSGGPEVLLLPETLRLLLDELSLSWEESAALLAGAFTLAVPKTPPQTPFRAPLGAVAALQPRTAKLVTAVNEKLCARLWDAFPGDWPRIGSAAVVTDGEADFLRLAAALCGAVRCTPGQRAGLFRTLYTIYPDRFTP